MTMTKIKFGLLAGIVALLGLMPLLGMVSTAHADDLLDEVNAEAGLGDEELTTTLGAVINVVLSLLGIILLIIIIYAGFMWMTAGGDTGKVEKAKSWLINAVIGMILVLAAYAISSFVITELAGAGLGEE